MVPVAAKSSAVGHTFTEQVSHLVVTVIVSGDIDGGILKNVVSHTPFTHFTTQVVITSL